MARSPRNRRSDWLAFLLTAILAVWVGGSVAVDTAVVPGAFRILDRNEAVEFGTRLFRTLNFTESILGAVAVPIALLLGLRGWGSLTRHRAATGILLGMTLVAVLFLLVLTPAITGKVDQLRAMLIDFEDETAMPPEREAIRSMHTLYAALDGVKILAGFTVLWLLATRRRSPAR
jgi:uncharacterized membrane protein